MSLRMFMIQRTRSNQISTELQKKSISTLMDDFDKLKTSGEKKYRCGRNNKRIGIRIGA